MSTKIENLLNNFSKFLIFLSSLFGSDTEIVLYNVEKKEVFFVINPLDNEMIVGSKIRSLEQSMIDKEVWKNNGYFVNYRSLSKSQHKLKSATYFITSDDNKNLYGILTINVIVDRLIDIRNFINDLISGVQEQKNENQFLNSMDLSVTDFAINAINEEIEKYGVESSRLSADEKLQIVKKLDNKGIFLVKGSITELSKIFNTTETTIYRYINRISNIK